MPLRNPEPIDWRPTGVSDTTDGSEAFPGAMTALSDLVPSLTTNRQWVARQAAVAVAAISNGNFESGQIVIGDILYGMIANGSGFDVPFAYNLQTNTSLTISGITAGNSPTSPSLPGSDWTPPIMAQVGSRIVVTHPGFSGTAISTATNHNFTGNTTNGSPTLYGQHTYTAVGDTLIGTGIPASTTASAVVNGQLGTAASCSGTIGAGTFTIGGATTGVGPFAGNRFTFQSGSLSGISGYITNVSGTTVTWAVGSPEGPAGANSNTFSGAAISWGGSTITMSNNATATSGAAGVTVRSHNVRSLGASIKFGWFDISSASIAIPCNMSSGRQEIGITNALGLQPGMTVTGTGIPANTVLKNLSAPSRTLPGNPPNAGDVTLIIQVANPNNLPLPGMAITGIGIGPGTVVAAPCTILNYNQATHNVLVPLSYPAPGAQGIAQGTTTTTTQNYLFNGTVAGFLSNAVSATGINTLTFAGGTPTAPLWDAGDTAYNSLPSQPVGVAQMAGRAYFACGVNGFPFSDSLLPASRTFDSQAVVPSDGLSITAVASLPLSSPITGGIIQAIIGFAGASRMYQITGDQATNNLALNTMNIATGTLAPLSITPSTLGLAFISPEGMRFVEYSGQISEPIGNPQNGAGVAAPFMNASHPSRICGASNSEVIRFTTTQGFAGDQEWVFWTSKKVWTGPNTFCYTQISPWRQTFVTHPLSIQGNGTTSIGGALYGHLYTTSLTPIFPSTSTYFEAGYTMNYVYQTVLLPDNPEQDALGVTEAGLWFAGGTGHSATITATDDNNTVLDTVTLTAATTNGLMRMIPIDQQWVFRAVSIKATGRLDSQTVLGRLSIKYQKLGYQIYPA